MPDLMPLCVESRSVPTLDNYWAIEPSAMTTLMLQPEMVSLSVKSKAQDPLTYQRVGKVALVNIQGVLTKHPSLLQALFGIPTMTALTRQVESASLDNEAKAIMLMIDSPGGTVAGTSDLADAVYKARRRKPVFAYASDMMASAAYEIGSQADHIYADSDAMIGSIGTFAVVPDFSGLFNSAGIKVHIVKAGELKGAGTVGTEVTDTQLEDFQRVVNDVNDVFLQTVARGRKIPLSTVRDWADGRVHVGKKAQALGLIDGVKSFDSAMSELIEVSSKL
jgi:capsid assembly protease